MQIIHQLQILLICLAKTDTGIQDDLVTINACTDRCINAPYQIIFNIFQKIRVRGFDTIVHQNTRHPALSYQTAHRTQAAFLIAVLIVFIVQQLVLKSPYVIDHIGTCAYSCSCDSALVCVQ